MSESRRRLQRQAKSLRAMLGELPTPWSDRTARQPGWSTRSQAPATIGVGAEVSLSALTEHLLQTWMEWFQVSRLYSQYFGYGRGDDTGVFAVQGLVGTAFAGLPRQWTSLHRQCQEIKEWVREDRELPDLWAQAWGVVERSVPAPDDTETWFLLLVESHERRRLLGPLVGLGGPGWNNLLQLVVEEDRRLGDWFNDLSGETRAAVLDHLRFYRHATLDASWLSPEGLAAGQRPFGDSSELHRLTVAQVQERGWIDALGTVELDAAVRAEAQQMLLRIQSSVWEFGFTCLTEDLHAPDFQPATRGPVGTPAVEVNPDPVPRREPRRRRRGGRDGDSITHFAPVVERWAEGREQSQIGPGRIVLSTSPPRGKGWRGVARTLENLVGHLGLAEQRPDLVVVITDSWDSAAFARQFRRSLRPHASAGVQFMFLLAGAPDRLLSRINVAV